MHLLQLWSVVVFDWSLTVFPFNDSVWLCFLRLRPRLLHILPWWPHFRRWAVPWVRLRAVLQLEPSVVSAVRLQLPDVCQPPLILHHLPESAIPAPRWRQLPPLLFRGDAGALLWLWPRHWWDPHAIIRKPPLLGSILLFSWRLR